jgi:hypothetical protein
VCVTRTPPPIDVERDDSEVASRPALKSGHWSRMLSISRRRLNYMTGIGYSTGIGYKTVK